MEKRVKCLGLSYLVRYKVDDAVFIYRKVLACNMAEAEELARAMEGEIVVSKIHTVTFTITLMEEVWGWA